VSLLPNILTALLDASDAARRPEPAHTLWLAPAKLGTGREAEALLTRVLEALRDSQRPVQLIAYANLSAPDLGAGSWRQLAAGRWEMLADFDAVQFLGSQVHIEGNYSSSWRRRTKRALDCRPLYHGGGRVAGRGAPNVSRARSEMHQSISPSWCITMQATGSS
jgi:hypothetical protein